MKAISDVVDEIIANYKKERPYVSPETILFSTLVKLSSWHPEVYEDIVKRMGGKS